jgi:hypothetical protein
VQPVLVTVNFLDGQIQNLEKSLCQPLSEVANGPVIGPFAILRLAARRQLWLYLEGRVGTNAGQSTVSKIPKNIALSPDFGIFCNSAD